MPEECRTCRFSENYGGSLLYCRRYPPTHFSEEISRFPLVARETWCGEWQSDQPGDGVPVDRPSPRSPFSHGRAKSLVVETQKRKIVDVSPQREGGLARARALSDAQRRAIAEKAALARWDKT